MTLGGNPASRLVAGTIPHPRALALAGAGPGAGPMELSQPIEAEPLPTVWGFYASWGRRFAAWAIDAALIAILSVAVTVIGIGRADNVASALVSVVLLVALPPTYYVAFTGSARGQTPGKMALGIAVRRRESLGRLGYGRAFGRWLVTAIFWAPFTVPALLDGLWPLVDSENRSWHDLASGSVVIRL